MHARNPNLHRANGKQESKENIEECKWSRGQVAWVVVDLVVNKIGTGK